MYENKIKWAVEIADKMHDESRNVLIHWADGWDRTTWLWSLVQVFLDPYFRTIEGLEVLIEKDWASFGHKFEDRSGHFQNHSSDPKERAPVFIWFLDCLYQLILQFPTAFEFNNNLLVFLSHHVYTWKFGTFLCNSEKERKQKKLKELTVSIWSYVNTNLEYFTNPFFKLHLDRIKPHSSMAILSFWKEHFLLHTNLSMSNWKKENIFPYDDRDAMYLDALQEIERLKEKLIKQN